MDKNFLRPFEDDPFFSGMPTTLMPLSDGRRNEKRSSQQMMDNPFMFMENMRNDMMKNFETFDSGNGHSFCSSSYMTYTNDGKSKPKYYEATSTTRSAPGEIKETRKTVRDSEKELEKMAIGRHMGKKGKIMERRRIGGREEEEINYLHMNEDEDPAFTKEWEKRSTKLIQPSHHRQHQITNNKYQRANSINNRSRSSFFDGGGFNSSPPPSDRRATVSGRQQKNNKIQMRE